MGGKGEKSLKELCLFWRFWFGGVFYDFCLYFIGKEFVIWLFLFVKKVRKYSLFMYLEEGRIGVVGGYIIVIVIGC